MKIKHPFVIDIAYNNATAKFNPVTNKDDQIPPDWSVPISPMPDAVICKATEANNTEDITFGSNWRQLGEKGIPRGAYHFNRWWVNEGQQAKFFVNVINKYGGLKNGDLLFLDVEEEGHMSTQAIVDFLWNVEYLTGNRPLIYSRALLLNNISLAKLNPAQKQYIKTTPVWIAGTYNNPDAVDNYATPPTTFIPDQTRFGKLVIWQYGLDVDPAGMVTGIPGGLDFDWVDPAFFAQWKALTGGQVSIPQAPTATINSVALSMSDGSVRTFTDVSSVSITVKSTGEVKII